MRKKCSAFRPPVCALWSNFGKRRKKKNNISISRTAIDTCVAVKNHQNESVILLSNNKKEMFQVNFRFLLHFPQHFSRPAIMTPRMSPIKRTRKIPPTFIRFSADTPDPDPSSVYEKEADKYMPRDFLKRILTMQVPPPRSFSHHFFLRF